MASGFQTTIYHFKTDTEYVPSEKGIHPRTRHVVRGYSLFSTAHGIPQIQKAQGTIKRAIWVLFLLLAVVGLCYNMVVLTLTYTNFPVLTKITLFYNRSLPFPAVTVCNTNPIKSSKAVGDPRILALLESWGIAVNGTVVHNRKKSIKNKQVVRELPEASKQRQKRSNSVITYFEQSNYQCTGNNLVPERSLGIQDCQDLCDVTLGCVAVQRVGSTGICSIRGECVALTPQHDVNVYIKKDPTHGYSVYSDINCPDNDITSPTTRPDPWQCSLDCDELLRCAGFVYDSQNSRCYIKQICDASDINKTESAQGYTTYIKTGRAAICSSPRARIECPGSYPGINQSQCLSLSTDCCYDTSQDGVPFCYLDTLIYLYHSHIHTIFRVAEETSDSPNLYSLWTGSSVTPSLESELTADYFSVSNTEKHVYKSAIVECVWHRVTEASVMLYSSGDKKIFFNFDASGQDKISWYSPDHLSKSSYSDATSTTAYNYFSIEGHDGPRVKRRWFVNRNYNGCSVDAGWWTVLDMHHSTPCDWDTYTVLPKFLYSRRSTADKCDNYITAETFFTKVRLYDLDLGGFCVSTCVHLPDAFYQSCLGCNVYVTCTDQVLTYHSCHTSLVFDVYQQTCVKASKSCLGTTVTNQCLPNECDRITCQRGGTCTMIVDGWMCLCLDGFSGRYCEICGNNRISEYQLYCDSCVNNTITVTTESSVESCISVCDSVLGCVGFEFTVAGECSTKSRCSAGIQSSVSDTIAYTKSDPSHGFHLFLQSECVSENLQVVKALTPLACSWRCNLLDLACQVFEFKPPHLCMLKHTCNETVLAQNGTVDTYIKYKGKNFSLHTLFRAANSSSDDVLSIWSFPSISTVTEELRPEYLGTDSTEKHTYLSPLVHCVWNKVTKIQVSFFAADIEQVFYVYSGESSTHLDWFSANNLQLTSYMDILSELAALNDFSTQHTLELFVSQDIPNCMNTSTWSLVLTNPQTSACVLETGVAFPRFLYCPANVTCKVSETQEADTFFIKAELDTSDFRAGCVSDCVSLADGFYQSCLGCNVYVECTTQVLQYHTCINEKVFDSSTKQCEDHSTTCTGGKMNRVDCKPDGCASNPCYNGGTCQRTLYSFNCKCPPRYTGEYCEQCIGGEQTILTWAANVTGAVYADGTLIASTSIEEVPLVTRIPCGTNMLAFELTRDDTDDFGLVGTFNTGWSTGISDGMYCTDSVRSNWKQLGFDDSDWPRAVSVKRSHDLSSIDPAAHWVWAEDTRATKIYCRYSPCSNPDLQYVTCDDSVIIYADGEYIKKVSNYESAVTVEIPCGTDVVAYKATNVGGPQGLRIAYKYEDWGTGYGVLVCTTGNVQSGWKLSGFDDKTWQFPAILQGMWMPHGPAEFKKNTVKWVWTSNKVTPMYCRQHRCDGQYILNAKADYKVVLYVDGRELINTGNQLFERRIPCNTEVVAFKITIKNGLERFIASYNNGWATGSGSNTGNLTTLCTAGLNTTDIGNSWTLPGFNDSGWNEPSTIPPDNHHNRAPNKVSANAEFIWWRPNTSLAEETIYCRQTILTYEQTTVQEQTTIEWMSPETTTTQNVTTELQFTTVDDLPGHLTFPADLDIPDDINPFLLDDIHNPPINYAADGHRDDFKKLDQLFKILAETEDSEKRDLGYALSDLIAICEYEDHECTEKDFQWFFDAVHGNCYVFNSNWNHNNLTKIQARDVGRRHGLRLTLDIGQYEYIPKIGEAAGVVVVVHPGDQMSFPEDEGVVVLPGHRTGIAIRELEVERLPDPYGELDCFEDGQQNFSRNVFEELYSLKYGLNACYKTCYQRHIVESCGCGDPQYPIKGQAFGSNDRACDVNDEIQETCKQRVSHLFVNNELGCDCELPCHERKYKYTVSELSWPSEKYEKTLLKNFEEKYSLLAQYDISDFRRNLVGVEVYYEDFNYEKIQELPAYSLTRLFTDYAGVLGLWIGCSLFSVAEILELGLDLLLLAFYRLTKRQYRGKTWNWNNICCKKEEPIDTFDEVSECRQECDSLTEETLTPVSPSGVNLEESFDFVVKTTAKKKRIKKSKVEHTRNDLCGSCKNNYWRKRNLIRNKP